MPACHGRDAGQGPLSFTTSPTPEGLFAPLGGAPSGRRCVTVTLCLPSATLEWLRRGRRPCPDRPRSALLAVLSRAAPARPAHALGRTPQPGPSGTWRTGQPGGSRPSRRSQRGPWGSSEGHWPPCPQGASCCRGGGHTVPTPASHSGGQGLTPQFNAQRRVVRGQATEVHASHPRRLASVSDRGPWPAGGAHAQHRARRPSRANAPPTPRPAPGLEESAAPGAHWPLRPAGPAKRVRSR